jgi:hypothetical protein
VRGGCEPVQISWLIVSLTIFLHEELTMNPLIAAAFVIPAGLAVWLASIGLGVGQGYSRFSSTYLYYLLILLWSSTTYSSP